MVVDVSELRMGNLVCECPFVEETHWQHQVRGITEEYSSDREQFEGFVHFDNGDIWREEETYAVPIDKNLLLRFGFKWIESSNILNLCRLELDEQRNMRYDESEGSGMFAIETKGSGWIWRIPNINYAHQLQNFYFLITGKELPFDGERNRIIK